MQITPLTVGPIVGEITPTTVRLWGRAEVEKAPSGIRRCFGIVRIWPAGNRAAMLPVQYFKMNPNFDMTGVSVFTGLKAETSYEYQMGWFFSELELEEVTVLPVTDQDWSEVPGHKFSTAASRKDRSRSFVFGSCRYLLRLFGGLWTDSRGDKTFRSILDQINQDGIRTDHLLMLGDQIYADDLNILHFDETVDEYNARYREAFSQPHIRALMSQVSTYMTLDDHEIEDGWPAHSTDKDWIIKYPAAIHAYQTYQMSHSPVLDITGNRIEGTPRRFWYTAQNGCCDFFVTDTRTERRLGENPEIISKEQMQNLKEWLDDKSGRVKFIVSSVPLFPATKSSNEDKWGGFPAQQSELLDFLWSKQVPRVVFLAGDVHSALSAELVEQNDPLGYKVASVVSSSFYWPYPHNSRRAFDLDGKIQSAASANVYQ
ncbi:MAG: alkaline phosphatase family protein, partial [Anaerolineales bacterium]|nr:alkaline phosphatase family protein [Anaerolineales bacterium]